jgi:hypothetical protein
VEIKNRHPYLYSFTQQPGYYEALTAFADEKSITPELELLIIITTGI